uniref:Uncharacterized protein n=1 Tax=Glossina austeni TaxID=7395 RepID=A0A1A9VTW1_GLOAU
MLYETIGASRSATTPASTLPETFTRTIHGSHIICNHRLPRINTTFHLIQSSIYVKNTKNSFKSNDISITDQTITLTDLLQIWNQMALALLFALVSIAYPFLNKY